MGSSTISFNSTHTVLRCLAMLLLEPEAALDFRTASDVKPVMICGLSIVYKSVHFTSVDTNDLHLPSYTMQFLH